MNTFLLGAILWLVWCIANKLGVFPPWLVKIADWLSIAVIMLCAVAFYHAAFP